MGVNRRNGLLNSGCSVTLAIFLFTWLKVEICWDLKSLQYVAVVLINETLLSCTCSVKLLDSNVEFVYDLRFSVTPSFFFISREDIPCYLYL